MANFVLEDREGTADMTLFPDVFEAHYTLLETEEPVFVEGNVEVSDEGVQVMVRAIQPLAGIEMGRAQRVVLQLGPSDRSHNRLAAVRDVLSRHPGDCPVLLSLLFEGREVTVEAGKEFIVAPTEELTAELGELVGSGAVYFE